MSLSTSDRRFIKGTTLTIFAAFIVITLSVAVVFDLYHRELLYRLDKLCRAVPECIAERNR